MLKCLSSCTWISNLPMLPSLTLKGSCRYSKASTFKRTFSRTRLVLHPGMAEVHDHLLRSTNIAEGHGLCISYLGDYHCHTIGSEH